jgi:hypothetical protein
MWKNGLKHGYGTYDLNSTGLKYEGFWMAVITLLLPRSHNRIKNMEEDGSFIQMGPSLKVNSSMTSLSLKIPGKLYGAGDLRRLNLR